MHFKLEKDLNGHGGPIEFEGKVAGDALRGTFGAPGGAAKRPWKATREKRPAAPAPAAPPPAAAAAGK